MWGDADRSGFVSAARQGPAELLYAKVERALWLDLDHLVLGPHGAAVREADLHPQQPVVLLLPADGHAARDHLGVIGVTRLWPGLALQPPIGPWAAERFASSAPHSRRG